MSGGHYDYPAFRIEMMAEQMKDEGRDEAEIRVVKACGDYLEALDYRESSDISPEDVDPVLRQLFEAVLSLAKDKEPK
jgi:hypothetical protein